MAKKRLRSKQTSKGIIGNPNRKIGNAVRAERSETQNMLNMFRAFEKGKKTYVTIDNPNPLETNKRRIRVLATQLYGDPKTWRYGGKKEAKN